MLFAVVLFGFILIKSTPGDPAMIVAGPMATPDVIAKIRVEMGLDQPTVVQFWRYLARLAQGDLGRSMINNTRADPSSLSRWLIHNGYRSKKNTAGQRTRTARHSRSPPRVG